MTDPSLQYNLTYKDVVTLLRAVREADGMSGFSLEFGDLKLSVTKQSPTAAADQQAPALVARAVSSVPATASVSPVASDLTADEMTQSTGSEVAVTAPMLGVFYRAPSPSEPAFVQEGDVVMADQTIGLIEAMKLFTAIPAGVAGRVVRVIAKEAELIEFGQTIVIIEPGRD